jgi:hypothetical protein
VSSVTLRAEETYPCPETDNLDVSVMEEAKERAVRELVGAMNEPTGSRP